MNCRESKDVTEFFLKITVLIEFLDQPLSTGISFMFFWAFIEVFNKKPKSIKRIVFNWIEFIWTFQISFRTKLLISIIRQNSHFLFFLIELIQTRNVLSLPTILLVFNGHLFYPFICIKCWEIHLFNFCRI